MTPHELLIVDDSAMMRMVIRNLIDTRKEYQVVEAVANGKLGLEALDRWPKLGGVLLDLEMPEMDGFEFLRKGRLRTRAKIVVLSSIVDLTSPAAARARASGADAVVQKPSGAVSFDLADKKGHELFKILDALLGVRHA